MFQVNEKDFYKSKPGKIYIDPTLLDFVDLKTLASSSGKTPTRSILRKNTKMGEVFGYPNTPKYIDGQKKATDLCQIAQLIKANWSSLELEQGNLLTSGDYNLFPVKDKDNCIFIVMIYISSYKWCVYPEPFEPLNYFSEGSAFFTNQ